MENAKIEILKENFEILKDAYNSYNSANKGSQYVTMIRDNILLPALSLDITEGVKMWEYLLKKYLKTMGSYDYGKITNQVFHEGEYQDLKKAVSQSDDICKYVFRLNPQAHTYYLEEFIGKVIFDNDFNLADKLVDYYIMNDEDGNNTQTNTYTLLQSILTDSETKWNSNSAGLDYLAKLLPQVTDPVQKAEIDVDFLALIDVVENDAPRGPIPFNLLVKEGGMELLMDEKRRENNLSKDFTNNTGSVEEYLKDSQERKKETGLRQGSYDEEEFNKNVEALNNLIGLDTVKEIVISLSNMMHIRLMRQEQGLAVPDLSQHLVFTGNPGTGKTTVARILGKIYHSLGILSQGQFIEVDRSGLVAGYVGQTAIKTKEIIDSAIGGILFIDEAYSLARSNSDNDYGKEAIDTLLKAMEDNRDNFVVIVAGYSELMQDFINSNPGLKSRFNQYIAFPDYTGEELFAIFMSLLDKNDYVINEDAKETMRLRLNDMYANRDDNFGNGRDVRNLFEKIITAQANRLMKQKNVSRDELKKIIMEDLNE